MIENFIEVELDENNIDEDFLKIRETLTRIGIASRRENKLMQSCHILHKRGRYFIVHFKELFLLDGKQADFTEDDVARRNTIASLLEEWKLLKIKDASKVETPKAPLSFIKILPYKDKNDWELVSLYSIGKK
jgi:hypothetical protein